MECFSPADESKSGSRFQHSSSNHHTTSSTQARDSSSKVKNMLYPSGFIIFRESLHQNSQARVCCEMRHVMTCTFVWGSTGSANSAPCPHGIQAGILCHACAVSFYRANNPIKTSQVTPLFIYVHTHQVSLQLHRPGASVSTNDV